MVEYNERLKVYHRGQVFPYLEVLKATYNGKWMGESSVTFDVASPEPIRFAIGDYLYFRGHRFELNYEPSPKQTSSGGTAINGFTYSGVKFNDLSDELTRCDFLDTVLYDNHIHYYGLPTFSFYCETPQQLCERIKANLDRLYTGEKEWTVEMSPTAYIKEHYDHTISVDKITCMEALALANKQWDLNFVIYDRHIIVGSNGRDVDGMFKYGMNNRLTSLQKSSDSGQKIVTRLHAYGNDKNLPHLYYQDKKYRRFRLGSCLESDGVYKGYVEDSKIGIFGIKNEICPYIKFDVNWTRMTGISAYFVDKETERRVNMTIYQIFYLSNTNLSENPVDARISISEGFDHAQHKRWYHNFLVYKSDLDGDALYADDFLEIYKNNVDVNGNVDIHFEAYVSESDLPLESRTLETDEVVLPIGISLNNLMLPGFPDKSLREMYPDEDRVILSDDPFDPWILSKKSEEIGIREGTTFFNADGNDNHDVYPTLEDTTADMLRAAGYEIKLRPNDNGHLDEIAEVVNPTDDGDSVGKKEGEIEKTFVVHIKDIGFDINDYTDGSAKLITNTGMCSGREFTINSCEKEEFGYKLTLSRNSENNIYYPNNKFTIKEGDKFVLVGIYMPRIYVEIAAAKLYEYAIEWLLENDHSKNVYVPEVDNIWLAEDFYANGYDSVYATIMPGDKLKFKSEELEIDCSENGINVDTISIKVGESDVANVSITLKDKSTVSTIQKVQQQINYVQHLFKNFTSSSTSNFGEAEVRNIIDGLDLAYLRKDNVFTGTNTFGDVVFTNIKTSDFVSGMTGSGAAIYSDSNGSHIESDYITIRRKLEVLELQIQRMSHIGGQIILSAADCVVDKVEMIDSAKNGHVWRCYFKKEDADGNRITNDWVIGDQARCQTFNLEAHDGFSGNKYYWRKVLDVGSNDEYHYIDLYGNDNYSAADSWDINGRSTPSAGDKIVLFGSQSGDDDRENAIVEAGAGTGSPYHRQYKGIKEFSLDKAELRIDLNPYDSKLKVSSMTITATGGNDVNVGEALSDSWSFFTTENEARKEGKDYVEWMSAAELVPNEAERWDSSVWKNYLNYQIITPHGITYKLDMNGDEVMWHLNTDRYLLHAQETADAAVKNLDDMASDNIITLQEKPRLNDIYTQINEEGTNVFNDATQVGMRDTDTRVYRVWRSALMAMINYIVSREGDVELVKENGEQLVVTMQRYDSIPSVSYDVPDVVVSPMTPDPTSHKVTYKDCYKWYYYRLSQVRQAITVAMRRSIDNIVINGSDVNEYVRGQISNLRDSLQETNGIVSKLDGDVGALATIVHYPDESVEFSGFVTKSNFASVFSSETSKDGNEVSAIITAYVDKGVSGISLSADNIDFSAENITMFSQKFRIDADNFKVNDDGVYVRGEIHATSGTFDGTVKASQGFQLGYKSVRYVEENRDEDEATILDKGDSVVFVEYRVQGPGVILPQQPLDGQVVKIISTGSFPVRVYSNNSDIVRLGSQSRSVTVPANSVGEFIYGQNKWYYTGNYNCS